MFKQILCPIDLKKEPVRVLEALAGISSKYNSKITLLHISEDLLDKDQMLMTRVSINTIKDENKEFAKTNKMKMNQILEKYNLTGDTVVRSGKASDEIIEFSEKNMNDLIIIGDNGRHRLSDYLLGSTSSRVVNGVDCSVLVISNR